MAEDILPPTQGFTRPAPSEPLTDLTLQPMAQGQSRDYGMDYDNAPPREPRMGVWEAAFKWDNEIVAATSRKDAGLSFHDDGTDPIEDNKQFPQYASMPERFVDVFNKEALTRRRAQIDQELEIRAVQERSPWLSAGASMVASTLSPTTLVPALAIAKIGKGAYVLGRAGMTVGTGAAFAGVGASVAGAVAAQEAILQSQQQTRTWEESAAAIGGSFVLGGLLGVGGATLARAFSQPATRSALATVDAMIATNGTAGAASVATPAMVEMVTRLKGAERVTSQEIEAATKTAMFEARQGRDLSDPDVIARVQFIDRLSTEIQRAARVSQVSELEGVVRNSFGSDGARLIDQGGVKVVQSVEDLPARADGVAHFDDTRGMFDGNTAYIVADNVAGQDVRGVVLHEVGVHYGMQRMLGDVQFQQLLDDVTARARAGEARFAEARAAVPAETPPQHMAEEVLAYLVENAPETGIVQRVIAAVKQFIRQTFGGGFTNLSEAEIRQLAVASLRKWNPEARPSEIRYSRKARGSSIDYRVGDESLEKYGLKRGERYNTREIAAAMEARQRDLIGTIARDDFSEESAKKIGKWMTEEVKWAVDQQKNGVDTGVGWYSEKYQRALDQFADVFPELKTDKTKRDFFTALVAIMSDGQKVYNNFIYAARMYDTYRTSGRLPEDVTFGGERSTSMRTNLAAINHLIAKYGEEGMAKYLMQEFTVSQLAKMAKESGVTFSTSYKADTTLPLAALVFGPKLGAFYSNLMGSHGYLTMDRWWTRTFNRYRGQLLSRVSGTEDAPVNTKGEAVGLARFKGMIGEPNISDEEALSRLKGYADSYAAKGFKNGTDIEKAANTLYKDAFVNLEDQPFNASDRAFMIKAANEAQRTLKKHGVDLSIADIQAVLWYYEKRLYGDLGARQSADVSYEEAAARVVRNSKDAGPGRWSAQDDGADAVRGPDGIDRPLDPDEGEATRYSRRNQDAAAKAPAPIKEALESGRASVVSNAAIFYSRAGEKREKAGIIVYHGSPHDFDRFSMDKIGTGEGAQAYGHGLYFAENEGVAKSYRDALSDGNIAFDGRPLVFDSPDSHHMAYRALKSPNGNSSEGAISYLSSIAPKNEAERAAIKEAADLIEQGRAKPLDAGSMYEVRINADPEQFLDWDKPLSEQPHITEALKKSGMVTGERQFDDWSALIGPNGAYINPQDAASRAYIAPQQELGAPAASEAFKNAGIPGIKYLDAGSRSAGDGSRNYVVFDDKLVEVIRKYSRGGSRNERIAEQLEALSKALDNIDNPDAFVAAMSSRGGSVGAEAVAEFSREDLQTYGKRANMVQDATWWLNPILRLRESPNPIAQKLGQMIYEDVIKSNMHMQGQTMGPQVETLVRQQLASVLGRAAQQYENIYQEGVKSGMRITRNQFSEAISAAMRRGDASEIPAVVKAAKMWRDVVFDPLKKMAQETRIADTGKFLLDPDIETKFAESYLHRMANHQKLTADEFGFKNTVADWMEGAMRNEYTKSSAATRARLAALDQDKVDLQLDPEARLLELEKLEKAYEDLDVRFSREADIRRQDNELMAKAAELRRKGDRGGAKTALEEARAVRKSGGERYGEYLDAFKGLNRRQKNVDFGFAGMAERQDEIVGKMGDIHDANLRGLDRLVSKGQKLERDLARLDPQMRREKIEELRDQIQTVLEKTDKAAERLYNQVERAEKARARAALKVLEEKRAGGIKEALAGNTESKAAADDLAREKALEESIRKYVKAEQKRSDKLGEIRRRIDRLDALDLDGQADELREAVNALVVQQSDMMIGRGDKVQRLKDKLARVDPAIVQKKLDQIDKDKQAITKKFYDRWEVQMGGEGVDINASVAQPRFKEWAKEYADQTFQNYSGRSKQAGTMPDFAIPLQKGPLQERTLPVPDTVLEPWLESDIGTIAAKYARSMLGQIEVTRKFGRPGMDDQFKQFEDMYVRIREQINAAATPKDMMAVVEKQPSLRNAFEAWRRGDAEAKVTKERLFDWLTKREASDRTDLEAGLEMMLGKYANEENLSDFGSISRLLVQFNMLTKMGGYVIGSMTDVYRPAMVHGFKNYMQHGIRPLLSNLGVPAAVREELAQAGVGVEGWLRGYTTMNAGILDPYAPGSMVERMMEKMGRLGAKFSGMTWFNDFTRQVGGMESMTVILKAAMEKTNKDFLAVNGINPGMAQRIADQFKVHGSTIKGVLVAGTDKWSDVEAARVLRAAISKDVSTIFTEKSVGDVPNFANRPLGRVIFQFRGFAFASNQRVLMRGLQDDHQQFVGALVGMTTIGMMVAYLRSLRGGEDRYEKFMKSAENPGFWIGEGLDNSGIFSLLFEVSNTTEKLSQAAGTSINPIKNPLRAMFPNASQQGESTRFVRRDPLSAVLGPSASIPQDIGKAIAGVVDGDFRAASKITPLLSTHPGFSDMIKVLSGDSAFY